MIMTDIAGDSEVIYVVIVEVEKLRGNESKERVCIRCSPCSEREEQLEEVRKIYFLKM